MASTATPPTTQCSEPSSASIARCPSSSSTYVANVLRGDLGTSFVHGRSVIAVIGERLPATLLLVSTALALSSVVGVALGTLAARHGRRPPM